MLTLQPFDFQVVYIAGNRNGILDGLSRSPTEASSFPKETVEYTVCFLLKKVLSDVHQVAEESKPIPSSSPELCCIRRVRRKSELDGGVFIVLRITLFRENEVRRLLW